MQERSYNVVNYFSSPPAGAGALLECSGGNPLSTASSPRARRLCPVIVPAASAVAAGLARSRSSSTMVPEAAEQPPAGIIRRSALITAPVRRTGRRKGFRNYRSTANYRRTSSWRRQLVHYRQVRPAHRKSSQGRAAEASSWLAVLLNGAGPDRSDVRGGYQSPMTGAWRWGAAIRAAGVPSRRQSAPGKDVQCPRQALPQNRRRPGAPRSSPLPGATAAPGSCWRIRPARSCVRRGTRRPVNRHFQAADAQPVDDIGALPWSGNS